MDSVGELWTEPAKDAATGRRFSAPGSTEVILLDLGAAWVVLCCGVGVVHCAAEPPRRSGRISLAGNHDALVLFLFK